MSGADAGGGGGSLLTPEVLAQVGTTATYRAPEALSRASIRYYALAIGSDPGRWGDEAPPTLIFDTCQLTGRADPDGAGYLGHSWDLAFPVPCAQIRGGSGYVLHRPARAGDVITTTWTLTSIEERSGSDGARFLVSTSEAAYRGEAGDLIATATETNLHRPLRPAQAAADAASGGAPAGRSPRDTPAPPAASTSSPAPAASAAVAPEVPAAVAPDLERRLTQRHLIAYAGATWDWHRLHYDDAYARRAGMAGPVVDGQMLGALLAEQALAVAEGLDRTGGNRAGPAPRARLTRLTFRNRSPVVAGETVTCRTVAIDRTTPGLVRLDQLLLAGTGGATRISVGPVTAEVAV